MIASAQGYISLLKEQNLQLYALQQINLIVNECWHELVNHVDTFKSLNSSKDVRSLCALILSKIYFNLKDLKKSLDYAIQSGEIFKWNNEEEFTQILLFYAVDCFIQGEKTEMAVNLLRQAMENNQLLHVMGIGSDAKDLQLIQQAIDKMDDKENALQFLYKADPSHVPSQISSDPFFIAKCIPRDKLLEYLHTIELEPAIQIAYDYAVPFRDFSPLLLEFFCRNNQVDRAILKKMRQYLDSRSSLHHSSLAIANAFMNHSTTYDQFLRDNVDWMQRATNWTKFTSVAAIGVIHNYQRENSFKLMNSYLEGSPYSVGGALFALGLINRRTPLSININTQASF